MTHTAFKWALATEIAHQWMPWFMVLLVGYVPFIGLLYCAMHRRKPFELTTLLKSAYKSSGNKKSADGAEKVKKAPSAYNIFIKEQMELLKNDGASPKDRMRQATANWNKRKAETKEPVVEQEPGTESDE